MLPVKIVMKKIIFRIW